MANKHLKNSKTPTEDASPAVRRGLFVREQPAPDTEDEDAARERLSHRDRTIAIISIVMALVLIAACVLVWLHEDSFNTDDLVVTVAAAAVAEEEYIFDSGSGQVFAAVGDGLAVATGSGIELLDGSGNTVISMVIPMENPTIATCDDFAVFYDLGGTTVTVVDMQGNTSSITPAGDIISLTVSDSGYITITTDYTGYHALVEVYDPSLDAVYQWYSSSAWVLCGVVSPNGQQLAVLSYTSSGSEVRLFNLSQESMQASFAVEDVILVDVHWFTSNRLCAISTDGVYYFNGSGNAISSYDFGGQYLTGYAFGDSFLALALSPYRTGTTSVLVSLDTSGKAQGTAQLQSGIIWLSASGSEILVLVSDSAVLYSGSLTEKGSLTGLSGFKFAMLRAKGEALLAASNYAEIYIF